MLERPTRWIVCGLVLLACPFVSAQHQLDPETWIEMRKALRSQLPETTIDQEVAALLSPSSTDIRDAGIRLIDRGSAALPALHAALLDPDVEPRTVATLLQVIGHVGDPASVPAVLSLLRRDRSDPLTRAGLRALTQLPPTAEAATFVRDLAADGQEPWQVRQTALAWYGRHQEPAGRPFAEALRNDRDPVRRALALYVLARLGDPTVLEPITRMLAEGAPSGARDALLSGLAELTSPAEFEKRAPASLSWSTGYKDARRYTRYRYAPPAERRPLCREMLLAQMPGHLQLAVRCLLEGGHADELRPFAAVDLEAPGRAAILRNEIRRAGWTVIDTETEFRIDR